MRELGQAGPRVTSLQAPLRWRLPRVAGEAREMRSHCRWRRHSVVIPRSMFAGYRFPPEIVLLAVHWDLRFGPATSKNSWPNAASASTSKRVG